MATPTRAPHVSSWSAAAARKVSAAPSSDLPVLGDEHAGELADGRRLAGAVDADDEDDGGPVADAAAGDAAVHVGLDEREQVLAQPAAHGGLVGRAVDLDPGAQRLDELGGGLDAEVGGDEGVLDLLPRLLVELAARRAARAGPCRGRCWSGPAGRAAAAAARGRTPGARASAAGARLGAATSGARPAGRRRPRGVLDGALRRDRVGGAAVEVVAGQRLGPVARRGRSTVRCRARAPG